MNNTNNVIVKVGYNSNPNLNVTVYMVEQQKMILQPTIESAEDWLKKQGYRYVTAFVHGDLGEYETQYWIKEID